MKLKLLYTLGLLLCLSTFASSNECSRYCHQRKAVATDPAPPSAVPVASSIADPMATSVDPAGPRAVAPAGSDKAYSLTLIKLLYI